MITPQFTGQYYRDTTTGNIWKSNSTTPGDWSLVVQDMQVAWTPTNLKLGEQFQYVTSLDLGAPTLSFDQAILINGVDISNQTTLVSVAFPNLTDIDPLETAFGDLSIYSNTQLASVDCPLLTHVANGIDLSGNPLLTSFNAPSLVTSNWTTTLAQTGLVSLSLPALVTVANQFSCNSCTALTNVSMPSFVPPNGLKIYFTNTNLSAASVNHILARCVANPAFVSGVVALNGGTSAAPTGQGITDKNTLNARLAGLALTN